MDPSSSALSNKREQYRKQVAEALEQDPDPLAVYENFVKWTQDNYCGSNIAQSGLLELLEEATRQFKDDPAYVRDLRYFKLWSLYAHHVEDPAIVYAFLLENDIGTVYAQLYHEYANSLETAGKRKEADVIYRKGIERRARPPEPLKRRYEDFKKRSGPPPSSSRSSSASLWKAASAQTLSLRKNPLMNYASSKAKPPATSVSPSTSGSHAHDRYAPMLAPPAPGKRPEKLRFNLSLLFTEDGVEYSMQEARARSMGLLGKKWSPPPPTETGPTTQRVNFNDDGAKGTRTLSRKYGAAEPTVTLATKEALADVFGMYNSPEKSMRFGAVAGSKHAPVHKIEPITPMSLQAQFRAVNNENMNAKTPVPTFQPFVDEPPKRKENSTPAPPSKLKVFEDPEPAKLPVLTPKDTRRELSIKDSTTPASITAKTSENAKQQSARKPSLDDAKPAAVFSSVFTPVAPKEKVQGKFDIFTDEQPRSSISPVENGPVFNLPGKKGQAPTFTPFVDQPPMKVFSKPANQNENAVPPQRTTFKPFVDEQDEGKPAGLGRPLGERQPFRAFTPQAHRESVEPEVAQQSDDTETTDEDEYDEYVDQGEYDHPPTHSSEDDSIYDEQDPDEAPSYQAPLGGRFGQFNVMTPITERTFEYTTSTRVSGTPGDFLEGFMSPRNAIETAEQLAAELQQEEADEWEEDPDVSGLEERTGTLSLGDALTAASSFRPPNPCNPFDPAIISKLLSLIPPDHDFHDLRHEESQKLDALEKFAKKKSRRNSGNTTSRLLEDSETLLVELADRRFGVSDKLGEGGFGAVFEALDLDLQAARDEDEDYEEDEEEGDKCSVALKVVKPRNLWEFHVLRSIHRSVSAPLRRSIIMPQALYAFRDESFLVLEVCKQGTLLDIVNRAGPAGITQQGACLDELLVIFFTVELMRLLEGLHRAGFIHGDVKIDNCLIRLEDVPGPSAAWASEYSPSGENGWSYKGIKMIDFGRTINTRLFPASQQYIAEWPTDARDCPEMREGRSWTYQTDYFGLAGIIYCMLYGKYIEASSVVSATDPTDGQQRYRLAAPFKRYWQVDLWTRLFDLLLNPTLVKPDGRLPVCDEMRELREEMEIWLQANCSRASNSLKGLLKKVGIAILGGKDGR